MPVTPAQFRRMALALPETTESAHMSHPDFRVCGKIFATLGYPDKKWAMVGLAPDQQEVFLADDPDVFAPAAGAWGRRGSTTVRLNAVKQETLRRAVLAAWLNAAPKALVEKLKTAGSPR